jgi:GAF domain
MRWLVEVTSLGKTEKESLSVEAESWQKALQAAREQRGESAPMSGFSIELLDDGCRAVDAGSRLRYDVHRASEEIAAPRAPSARPPNPSASAVPRARPVSQAPRPASQPPAGSSQPPPAALKRPPLSAAALSAIGQHPSSPPPAAAPPPPAAASTSLTSAPGSHAAAPEPYAPPPPAQSAALAPQAAAPSVTAAPTPVAPPPSVNPPPAVVVPRTDVGSNVTSQVIFKREHDATDSMPLTYREYVFLVPIGTTEQSAETLLQTQLELVLASLARVPAGKLVNLGVFDVPFQGKPPVPPLATLMWKDWRGAPVIEFPRRAEFVRQKSAPPPAVAATAATPPMSAAAPAHSPAPAYPPAPAAAYAPAPAPAYAPAPAPTFAPSAPVPAPAPMQARAPVAPAAPAPPIASGVVPLVTPSHSSAPPPAAAQPRSRVRGEDLIADLFESMHDLHFLRDAVEGGNFCLSLAMEKIPSQAGIVHLYDIDRREFLITSTKGASAGALLLRRHSESDMMLSAAMSKRRAIVVEDAAQSEAAPVERYVALGGARSLIVAPVMLSGRFLGAIELMNPLDGQPFTEVDGNALTYIAEQFAEFVESRGVVTDPERISSRTG